MEFANVCMDSEMFPMPAPRTMDPEVKGLRHHRKREQIPVVDVEPRSLPQSAFRGASMRKKRVGEANQLNLENLAADDDNAVFESDQKTIKMLREQLRAIQNLVERVSTKKSLDDT